VCGQVILELSKSNEALEVLFLDGSISAVGSASRALLTPTHQEQNRRLRIELLALRRSAREAGLVSVLTNSSLMGWSDETLGLAAAVGKEGPSGAAPGSPGAGKQPRRLLLTARTTTGASE